MSRGTGQRSCRSAIASLMALAIPFAITLAIPVLTGEGLGEDADLVSVSRAAGGPKTWARKAASSCSSFSSSCCSSSCCR